jgi:DNA polymerase III delta prime subunit
MAVKIYQSYIIVGDKKQTQDKVDSLLRSFGIEIGSSPDIVITIPEKSISITQVREIKTLIYQKPFVLKYRVYIIKEAEKLTIEAQSSLLKIFEEPPAHAIIILETSNPKFLLETLRSRAVFINLNPVQEKPLQSETTDLKGRLLSIGEATNPQDWINNQINNNYQILKKQISARKEFLQTTRIIESFKEAKLMMAANVNPKFASANAILSTQLS